MSILFVYNTRQLPCEHIRGNVFSGRPELLIVHQVPHKDVAMNQQIPPAPEAVKCQSKRAFRPTSPGPQRYVAGPPRSLASLMMERESVTLLRRLIRMKTVWIVFAAGLLLWLNNTSRFVNRSDRRVSLVARGVRADL